MFELYLEYLKHKVIKNNLLAAIQDALFWREFIKNTILLIFDFASIDLCSFKKGGNIDKRWKQRSCRTKMVDYLHIFTPVVLFIHH